MADIISLDKRRPAPGEYELEGDAAIKRALVAAHTIKSTDGLLAMYAGRHGPLAP